MLLQGRKAAIADGDTQPGRGVLILGHTLDWLARRPMARCLHVQMQGNLITFELLYPTPLLSIKPRLNIPSIRRNLNQATDNDAYERATYLPTI